MDKWDECASRAWQAILRKVKELNETQTQEQIARLLGIKNKGTISLWLKGERKAENTSFACMLRYLENLGFNYADFLPSNSSNIPGRDAHATRELDMLKAHINELEAALGAERIRASTLLEVVRTMASPDIHGESKEKKKAS